jgi:hypothetical protein
MTHIDFPDWVPPLAPPAPRPRVRSGKVRVISKLSTWVVPRVWMEASGGRPYHEMVLALGEHEVLG